MLPIENGRYLTFEFIGSTDVLSEGRGGQCGPRRRGAQNTTVDAAFLYPAGTSEKYVSRYAETERHQ